MSYHIQIAPDPPALCCMAAEEFARACRFAIRDHGRFAVALSGGNTPRALYALLAAEYKDKIPWNSVHIFFGDERSVPLDHPESNFRMANEALLSKVPVADGNVHRVRTELGPEAAAKDYEEQLRHAFSLTGDAFPRFDLILLGLGDDGHTASLFPGSAALQEKSRLAVANWVEKFNTWRITLTYPVLNHGAEIIFLVSGTGKAQIFGEVLDPGEMKYPAQGIQPENGRLLWLVDRDAARLLPASAKTEVTTDFH
jgi:6-phosphogluconolactonase